MRGNLCAAKLTQCSDRNMPKRWNAHSGLPFANWKNVSYLISVYWSRNGTKANRSSSSASRNRPRQRRKMWNCYVTFWIGF